MTSKVDIYSKFKVDSQLKHETQDSAQKEEKEVEPTENSNTNKFGIFVEYSENQKTLENEDEF